METWHDPIVEEVRSAREAYAERLGFDVRAICEDLRRRQSESGHPVVRTPQEETAKKTP